MVSMVAGPSKFSPTSSPSTSPARIRGRQRPELNNGEHAQQRNTRQRDESSEVRPSSGDEPQRGRSRHRRPSNQQPNPRRSGYHSLNIPSLSKVFQVEKRFKLVRELGHGAYGTVISVQDEISGEHVAIKQVERVFEKPSLAKRALREITLLRHFSDHENITGLIDMDAITPDFNEIYLFMEPMEADLHQIIRSGQGLTDSHLQYFVYQILRGLKYIHSAGVIHRDLKPGNLLVNSNCELKICDFGLSRGFDDTCPADDENATQLTEYVATRWYRAPEIMLSFKRYGKAIDLWSLGCILGELLLGRPMFKGKDYVDQLNKILDVLGTPDEKMIQSIKSERARKYVRSLPVRQPKSFSELIPMAEPTAIDLLSSLLQFDPDSRPDAVQALQHPYLDILRTNAMPSEPGDDPEPECPRKFERWRELENFETLEDYRSAIWSEIQEFRKEVRGMGGSVSSLISSRRDEVSSSLRRRLEEAAAGDLGDTASRERAGEGSVGTGEKLTKSEELVRAMESLELNDAGSQLNGEHEHHPHRLIPLPESSQAQYFSEPDSQSQIPPHRDESSLNGSVTRTRKDSALGGKMLRSLSTISVHEVTGGDSQQLYSKAAVGQYILQKSAADAPPSERPNEFN